MADLRGSFGYRNERTYETEECTIFVYDRGGVMLAPTGAIRLIYKAGGPLGEGMAVDLPFPPRTATMVCTPADATELWADGRCFTYVYRFDQPLLRDGLMVRTAGDFIYTTDLTTGKTELESPAIPPEFNTYTASLARVLAEPCTLEKRLESPFCTVLLAYRQTEDGRRAYSIRLVFKPGVERPEGAVTTLSLPVTANDGDGQGLLPQLYADRAPDTLTLSEDGDTLTYTYYHVPCEDNGGPYTATVDLKTGFDV